MQNQNLRQGTLVLDFDSTISPGESLLQLLELSIEEAHERNNSSEEDNRTKTRQRVRHLTDMGNNGELTLAQSIRARLEICMPSHTSLLAYHSVDRTTARMKEALDTFRQEFPMVDIHVVSGGPSLCVVPQAGRLGIPAQNVHALDLDLSRSPPVLDSDLIFRGKTAVLQSLLQSGRICSPIVIVGDSIADMLPRHDSVAAHAIGFGVHVQRPHVSSMCDQHVRFMDDFLPALRCAFLTCLTIE